MYFKQFLKEQSGCASYLVGDPATGEAAVIDPHWLIEEYLEAARSKGLKITYIIETHVHADHISGNRKLAALTQARICIHRAANTSYADVQLEDGDTLALGAVLLHILHTPGHTPESIVIMVSDTSRSSEPWLALTGDTIFIDDVGRPDLAGPDGASEMFDSLRAKLLKLDSAVEVYPAHVAGSPCGRAMNLKTSSTIGYERRFNRALQAVSFGREYFVHSLTADLPPHSPSFDTVIGINRHGPPDHDVPPQTIEVAHLPQWEANNGVVLDVRDGKSFMAAHIPGALSVPLAIGQLAGRVAWLVQPGQKMVLVAADELQSQAAARELSAVFLPEQLAVLACGMAAYQAAGGQPLSTYELNVEQLDAQLRTGALEVVLDVREPDEWQSIHIQDAPNISYRELSKRWPELELDQHQPLAVICAGGVRSTIATSILEHFGFTQVFNVQGGMGSWQRAGLATVIAEPNDARRVRLALEQAAAADEVDYVI